MRFFVLENFFDNFDEILTKFKNIKLYTQRQFNNLNKGNQQTWVGKRSLLIHKTDAILYNLVINHLERKFFNIFNKPYLLDLYVHLRNKSDKHKDWIHRDNCFQLALLVYLSDDNLKSGTSFYNDKKQEIAKIKFVKNRALIFDTNYLHSAIGHHDNRLTLNGFINFK